MKNIIVVDFEPNTTNRWKDLSLALEEDTGEKWEFFGRKMINDSAKSVWRYIHYFVIGGGDERIYQKYYLFNNFMD